MNINLTRGELISQNKMEILKVAAENGQLTIEVDLMECKADYVGKAVLFHTFDIQYIVKYVSNNYVRLQQIATYPCRDGIQVCKYYCSVSNDFGCIEVEPQSILDYKYIIVPENNIGWM